jgi:uncharacterized protein YwqG
VGTGAAVHGILRVELARAARLLALLIALAVPARAAATPPTADQIVARAKALGVGTQAETLRSRFLPGVRLLHGGKDTPGSTRLGGKPDMARDATWPACGKHKLSFIMQVDVADLGHSDHGTLAIFADLEVDKDGVESILDFSGKTDCVVQTRFTREKVVRRGTPKGVKQLRRTPLQTRPTLTIPDWEAAGMLLGLKGRETVPDAWVDLVDETSWGALGAAPPYRPEHQLLGWSQPLQWEPTMKYGACNGDVSFVQVDADDKAGFDYGDAGVLYLDIKPADLKARRYDSLCGEFQDD